MDVAAELDELFRLPLSEFTSARNALASRLQKSGQREDATRVRALAKPSVSAWAVNQLYWRARDSFDRLIAAGASLRQAQAAGLAGRAANVQEPIRHQRDALHELSRQAVVFLSQDGHAPSADTLRRVTLDLQGLAAREPTPDGPTPGRLSEDVDAPGFESLAALVPRSSGGPTRDLAAPTRVLAFPPGKPAAPSTKASSAEARERAARERAHVEKVAAGRALADATRALTAARNGVRKSEATMKAAASHVKAAERERQKAETALERATAGAESARAAARKAASAAADAAQALDDAERAVAQAKNRIERL